MYIELYWFLRREFRGISVGIFGGWEGVVWTDRRPLTLRPVADRDSPILPRFNFFGGPVGLPSRSKGKAF